MLRYFGRFIFFYNNKWRIWLMDRLEKNGDSDYKDVLDEIIDAEFEDI